MAQRAAQQHHGRRAAFAQTAQLLFQFSRLARGRGFDRGIGILLAAVADNGVGMTDKKLAIFPEKRGADYVAIFVRQLGGTFVVSKPEATGTIVRIRLPLLLEPPSGAEPLAA